jgi:hypothetical protein
MGCRNGNRYDRAPHAVALHFRGLRKVNVSPYWLGDPEVRLCVTRKKHARFGIPTDHPVAQPKRCDSSHAVASTPGYNPTGPASHHCHRFPERSQRRQRSATLMKFNAPTTFEPKRVHFTPAYLTGYVPSSGFLTLSTVYSSLGRPILFHTGNAHGVLTLSKGFPSLSSPTSSSPMELPSWRCYSAFRL